MDTENRISLQIPPEVLSEVNTLVRNASEKLEPYLTSLTPIERKTIPKMNDASIPFVQNTLAYSESNPKFSPPYLDVAEMKIDLKAATDLTTVFRPLEQLYSLLNDTIMLCGSEAYTASLTYYNSVKFASKKNVAGAKVIYDDLKKRFEVTKTSEEETQTPVQN